MMSTETNNQFSDRTVYFTSLGCSKNLVDSQVMLGYLGLDGYKVVPEPADSEVIIVNTCSFIEASKKESIEVILDMADYKNQENGNCKALVVSGCMAQRYAHDLEKEMPEVDLFIGTGEYHKITQLLSAYENRTLTKKSFVEIPKFIHTEFDPRLNTSPSYTAWLKISEGCNRNCTFCIIPSLRGRLRSRSVESLVTEAEKLVASGVRELNLISQDLSDYGSDLDENNNLYELLCGLEKVENVDWLRLFYLYPDDLTDEVIDKIASSEKVCKYLDMPIQHFSTDVLRRMNRKIEGGEILRKIRRLREKVPGIVLRTSLIVGFPGETEEDFQQLLAGVEEIGFDHLGVFRYSDEEGTPAYRLKDKISQEVIEDRFNQVYEIQREIVEKRNQQYLGKTLEVLVEGHHEETELLIVGRHQGQAPDIDGKVIINDLREKELAVGDLVSVTITEVLEYDLIGSLAQRECSGNI